MATDLPTVSLRMMEHAAELDLVSFEDPIFYDKMERPGGKRQAVWGCWGLGNRMPASGDADFPVCWCDLVFALVFLLLLVAVVPAFLRDDFAMLSYSLLYRYTPERRQLDYLRMLGASNASAISPNGTAAFRAVLRREPPACDEACRKRDSSESAADSGYIACSSSTVLWQVDSA
ncbi:MAG: hypothetical protein WKF37_24815 [Bryobacteraceae bacterium]